MKEFFYICPEQSPHAWVHLRSFTEDKPGWLGKCRSRRDVPKNAEFVGSTVDPWRWIRRNGYERVPVEPNNVV